MPLHPSSPHLGIFQQRVSTEINHRFLLGPNTEFLVVSYSDATEANEGCNVTEPDQGQAGRVSEHPEISDPLKEGQNSLHGFPCKFLHGKIIRTSHTFSTSEMGVDWAFSS